MDDKPIRVLLVEDDEDDYLIIQDMLDDIQDTAYKLYWAKSYDESLQIISRETFDVFLVDYRLGEYTGLDLLEALNGERIDLPIILLTGIRDRQIDMAAMKGGAADFLVKGQFDENLLERAIRYAIERTRLIKKLNEMAIRDELTGLYNRREMKRLLDDEFERYERYGYHVSLIMLDIDHFKSVNDTFGHQVGDQVLKQVSQIIKDVVRSVDRTIRFGGEEFSILLPETIVDEALNVAERLRKGVESNNFNCKIEDGSQCEIQITISLGLAELPGDTENKDVLVFYADRALYVAKEAGRNQTVVYRNIDQNTKPAP